MARKPLSGLTDAELEKARELWEKLVSDTRHNIAQNPGPGWNSVIERLEEGWQDYEAEVARRSQPTPTP